MIKGGVKELARMVMQIAYSVPQDGRFGPNKVYIYSAWLESQKHPTFPKMSLEEFKELLKEASQQGYLYLSRADLVQVMPKHLVDMSEICWEGDNLSRTSHFILLTEV